MNPRREDLREMLQSRGLPVVAIEHLKEMAERGAPKRNASDSQERVVAVVEYRDGTVIDVVRMVSGP